MTLIAYPCVYDNDRSAESVRLIHAMAENKACPCAHVRLAKPTSGDRPHVHVTLVATLPCPSGPDCGYRCSKAVPAPADAGIWILSYPRRDPRRPRDKTIAVVATLTSCDPHRLRFCTSTGPADIFTLDDILVFPELGLGDADPWFPDAKFVQFEIPSSASAGPARIECRIRSRPLASQAETHREQFTRLHLVLPAANVTSSVTSHVAIAPADQLDLLEEPTLPDSEISPPAAYNGEGDVVAFLALVRDFFLPQHVVAGKYVRHSDADVQALREHANRLIVACMNPSRDPENFLVWGHSGEGKTFFVNEVVKSLPGVRYEEINLNDREKVPDVQALSELLSVTVSTDQPVVFALDEIDKRPDASEWLYPIIFNDLDRNKKKPRADNANIVFALIGSKQPDIGAFKASIAARPGGPDLLRRVPNPVIEIPKLTAGDRLVTALSMIWTARANETKIVSAQKLALAYLLSTYPTNGAIAVATEKALRNVAPHETSFTDDHLRLSPAVWREFYQQLPKAQEILFNSFVHLRH